MDINGGCFNLACSADTDMRYSVKQIGGRSGR